MIQLIQIADDPNTDTSIVRLVGRGVDNLIPQFTYLISDSEPNRFFLQIATANRNLSRYASNPFDTISLSQMLALLEDLGYSEDSIVSNITYYDARVEAMIDNDGKPETPFVRPTTGAINRLATSDEIIQYLRLPQVEGNDLRIGKLARSGEAEVAINLDDRILYHHMLVAGSTGSGKSELLSNIAHAASVKDHCVIIFDHKPDHQNHHEENLDAEFPAAFSIDAKDSSKQPVRYWTLDEHDPNNSSRVLGVRAMDLDSEILAGTIFYQPSEINQAETFSEIATAYATDQSSRNRIWTIHDLTGYVRNTPNGELNNLLYGSSSATKLNTSTMSALRSRLTRPGRIPSFIDPQPTPSAFGQRRPTSNIDDVFQPGLNVIRIGEGHSRGYALFLTRLLQRARELRSVAIQQNPGVNDTPELEVIIDEASDIFRASSRYLRDVATDMLHNQIRRGRTLRIGYVISVQSAGDVPEYMRNNLNTTIVGRHRNLSVLRDALPTSRVETLEQADRLSPGEMFVDLFEVPSLLLVKMDRSRSQLTVAD